MTVSERGASVMSRQSNLRVAFQGLAKIACTVLVFNAWFTDTAEATQDITVKLKVVEKRIEPSLGAKTSISEQKAADLSVEFKIYRLNVFDKTTDLSDGEFTLKDGQSTTKSYDMWGTWYVKYMIALKRVPEGYELGKEVCVPRSTSHKWEEPLSSEETIRGAVISYHHLSFNMEWSSKNNGIDCTIVIRYAKPSLALRSTAEFNKYWPQNGDQIKYDYKVTNTSLAQVVNEIRINTVYPATLTNCPIKSLEAGESTTCKGTHKLTQADIDRGGVTNTAQAQGYAKGTVFNPGSQTILSNEVSVRARYTSLTLSSVSVEPQVYSAVGEELT